MTALIVIAGIYGAVALICAAFAGLFLLSPRLRHRWLVAEDAPTHP
ncbi:hypothetical protein [Flavisphingomonas formosensis]|nr:hypothetical protein [Sphingomonas formosensis]